MILNTKITSSVSLFVVLGLLIIISSINAKKFKEDEKPGWAKKDIRDYSDADLERLLEQWEEDEDPLPQDELPEGDPRKSQPQLDLDSLDLSNPEQVLKASKKGKTLMMFVRVMGNPTKAETEEITSIWQTGLWNNHIQCERFNLEDNRVIFMFKDGSVAWEAKDFLIEQEKCQDVQIEQKTYHGKHTPEYKQEMEDIKLGKTPKSQKKSNKKKKKIRPKIVPKDEL